MKKKVLVGLMIGAMSLGFWGIDSALAFGPMGWNVSGEDFTSRFQSMVDNFSKNLGIASEKIKQGWSEGKSMLQIAEDNGLTQEQVHEKMQSARKEQMKTQLQALVSKGILTQAQADSRIKFMESQLGSVGGRKIGGRHGGGMGFSGWELR